MIRLVAFDLDGTLIGPDTVLRPRVERAIAETQARGIEITLATGRKFSATRPFAERLGITAPLICYQGGWIQAPGDAAPLYRVPLPEAVTLEVLALSASEGWHTILYADGEVFLDEVRYAEDFYRALLGETFAVGVPWREALASRAADKVLFAAEPDAIPAMGARLRARLGDRAEVVRSHARFVEVIPADVSKGRALAWLSAHLEIAQSAVMAVGDQENDLAMVRWAGVGVAMGDAVPELRRAADWVAPSWRDDGAAVALARFVLERAASP